MTDYYKNTELATQYNVSEATVRNWIKTADNGGIDLKITESKGRRHVSKDISNIPVIEKLVNDNRKYRNTLAAKTITPGPEFYNTFSIENVADIIRSLELYGEIHRKYGYFGAGAREWDEYIKGLMKTEVPSMARGTSSLLRDNSGYIDSRLARFDKVNVIDVGVGNGAPSKELVDRLRFQGKLGEYVAIDFSSDMLAVAENNFKAWFGEGVKFRALTLDIERCSFAGMLPFGDRSVANVVLFLGATPTNFRFPGDAFRSICESMGPNDLLIYTDGVWAGDVTPEWLSHSRTMKPQKPRIASRHRMVLDLLNVKDTYYAVEVGHNKELRQNYSRIRFKFAVTINFNVGGGRRVVQFERGDTITLWRSRQACASDTVRLIENSGFYVLHTSQSEDHNYILTIAEVQRS